MPHVNVTAEIKIVRSARVKQLETMFDIPPAKKSRREWHGNLPIEKKPWQIGLIVGPSGSGKSTILNESFRRPSCLEWKSNSVIDDFHKSYSIDDVTRVCQAVGFNTIPAWMRPHVVLSNGEKFRAELARRLLEDSDPIVVDEFTSVVDRQVAKIGAFAVQKYIRRENRQFIAASCHRDIIDWLQPDWIFEPESMEFSWREIEERPPIEITYSWVPRSVWPIFSPYHYMSASLSHPAQCFAAFIDGRIVAIACMLHRPHPRVRDIVGTSRLVTLPDWQGIGIMPRLCDHLGACYKAIGKRMRSYPAHPAFVRSFQRSAKWRQTKKAGSFAPKKGKTATVGSFGGRPCAVFEYCGESYDRIEAIRLIKRNARPT